jgi:hypothetical protein
VKEQGYALQVHQSPIQDEHADTANGERKNEWYKEIFQLNVPPPSIV